MKHYNPIFDCTLEFSAERVRILAAECLDQLADDDQQQDAQIYDRESSAFQRKILSIT